MERPMSDLIISDRYGYSIDAKALIEHGSKPVRRLQDDFKKFSEANPDNSYFEDEVEFMEGLGYKSVSRENTYNGESDLDANVVWNVWAHPEADLRGEWIYANSDVAEDGLPLLVTTFAFNYADPRGSYTEPEFRIGLFSDGEYSVPVDLVIGYFFKAKDESDAGAIDKANALNDEGRYQAGYSSHPTTYLEDELDPTRDDDGNAEVTVDGFTLIVTPIYY
jgi:hypothetical protein